MRLQKKILSGKIVTLKLLEPKYFQEYYTMFSSVVRNAIGIPAVGTQEETTKFLSQRIIDMQLGKIIFYCIFDNADNKLIGSIEIREPGFENGQLGCWVNEQYWGSSPSICSASQNYLGCAKLGCDLGIKRSRYQEALDLFLKEYFESTEEQVVNVYIKKENIRSLKAHQKYGFKIVREFNKDGQKFYELTFSR